jgi:RNA polymerase sigma-70 factor (ECF subfamily)
VVEHSPENDWVRKARTGDRAAFAALVDRYWDCLRRWLFGLTGKEHLAEDLTQEAFFRAWSALPRLQADVTFVVWLFRIARNCFLDYRRGPHGRQPKRLPADLSGPSADPLGELLHREAQSRLEAALGGLPTHYRAAYLLWTQEDLPYCQIAQVLAITEETARWRVCKARQSLLKEMKAYLDVGKR